MKRAPYPISPDTSGKQYWRSLGELEKTPEFAESQPREFPEDATEPKGVDRRGFLGIMGASLALTGLAACRRPEELIVPYTRAPEEFIPGRPVFYATALPFMGTAVGLVVESHEGRPTKIEGNPRHPESQGGTHKFLQSAVLDLYDPDRSQTPAERGEARNWDQATAFLRTLGDDAKRRNGKGLAIIVEDHRSPAMAAQLDTIVRLMPDTRIVRYEAFGDDNAAEGARAAFGRALVPVYDLDNADVVVSLDSDFLVNEGAPVRNARGYGARRDPERKDKKLNRFYAIESAHTVTGSNADHRLRLQSRLVPAFTYALARELADAQKVALPAEIAGAAGAAQLDPKAARYVKAIAADLAKANGAVAIIPGRKQPAAVHALVHAMNAALGAVGKAVKLVRPFDELKSGPAELVAVAKAIGADIDTVLILGSNPAFNAPADAAFGEALKKAKTVVHVGTHVDETGKLAHWHLNRAHPLEAWGDVRSEDGTGSIVQPLIAPMYGGKTDAEILELFLGGTRRGYDLVRASWHDAGTQNAEFDRAFRRALHDGVWDKSAWAVENADPRGAEIAAAIKAQQAAAPKGEYEVVFEPDPHTYDGRYANNGWLQEMPDTMHKLTWSNVAALAPSTARKLGIVDGDLVTVSVGGASVTLPALLAPGQADGTIVVTVGQGRTAAGRVGNGIGFATTPLRTSAAFHIADATLSKAGGSVKLPRTQEHFMTEGRPLVEEATAEEYAKGGRVTEEPKRYLSLFPSREYKDTAWGMTVDLSTCIACNACTVACQAENNISLVGAEGVLLSREMHWLRIDRYFEGPNPDEAKAVAQPMLCQHCENAPCEEVCPVAATSHSPEGLNEMTYNRCVGTKYCANNCPFKVRRFNYFDYTKDTIEQRKMQFNPDVTVRSRGVMEKCTFCVQRINGAKIAAKVENRPIKDGEIVTACQGACPTRAITFGDLNDKASLVAKKADGPRGYRLLEELNVRPRLVYLAKIRNPNPELEGV